MKRLGGTGLAFLYRIVIPNVMNGRVKSTTCSRSDVIVRSPIAKSASLKTIQERSSYYLTTYLTLTLYITFPIIPSHLPVLLSLLPLAPSS